MPALTNSNCGKPADGVLPAKASCGDPASDLGFHTVVVGCFCSKRGRVARKVAGETLVLRVMNQDSQPPARRENADIDFEIDVPTVNSSEVTGTIPAVNAATERAYNRMGRAVPQRILPQQTPAPQPEEPAAETNSPLNSATPLASDAPTTVFAATPSPSQDAQDLAVNNGNTGNTGANASGAGNKSTFSAASSAEPFNGAAEGTEADSAASGSSTGSSAHSTAANDSLFGAGGAVLSAQAREELFGDAALPTTVFSEAASDSPVTFNDTSVGLDPAVAAGAAGSAAPLDIKEIQESARRKRGTTDLGLLLLRVSLGAILLFQGLAVFFELGGSLGLAASQTEMVGYAQPQWLAILLPSLSLAAGVFLILGLISPLAGLLAIAATGLSLLNTYFVAVAAGTTVDQYEFGFRALLAVVALAATFLGAGLYGFDFRMRWAARPLVSSWFAVILGIAAVAAGYYFLIGLPFTQVGVS